MVMIKLYLAKQTTRNDSKIEVQNYMELQMQTTFRSFLKKNSKVCRKSSL